MPVVYGVIILLFLFGVFLLFAPLQLVLDSRHQQYALKWFGIASARFLPLEDDVRIRISLAGWQREWLLSRLILSSPDSVPVPKVKSGAATRKRRFPLRLRTMKKIVASFRIRRFRVDVDTDDYILNAWLFPLCYGLAGSNLRVRINFQQTNEVDICIENSGFRVLKALLTY